MSIFRKTLSLTFSLVLLLLFTVAPLGYASDQARISQETATFAGGCFWCMEPPFDTLTGVISTTSGYTGGKTRNPRYEEVSTGSTGHAEAVRITFDPSKISYSRLLQVFWHNIDPTAVNRQFCDSGNQYRSAIFYHNETQKKLAVESKQLLEKTKTFRQAIVTEINPAGTFYPAEEYHQDYYRKNPIRYKYYRYTCGRDKRLEELWGSKAGH
ncbi:MAG: peptide-methionine (S)-S-oxide reductase [Deltaproteobacteria bacterium]|nr:peptide-methionine (S)-S-oxide reductase [Deltaproteobacteria bacterium]